MVISPPLSPCRQYTTYGGEELVGRAFRPCALVTVSQIGFSCQLMWLASVWLALASAVETQDQAGAPLYPPSSEDPPTAPAMDELPQTDYSVVPPEDHVDEKEKGDPTEVTPVSIDVEKPGNTTTTATQYRLYKRRWIGVFAMVSVPLLFTTYLT